MGGPTEHILNDSTWIIEDTNPMNFISNCFFEVKETSEFIMPRKRDPEPDRSAGVFWL